MQILRLRDRRQHLRKRGESVVWQIAWSLESAALLSGFAKNEIRPGLLEATG
jgi:hypothetical protein